MSRREKYYFKLAIVIILFFVGLWVSSVSSNVSGKLGEFINLFGNFVSISLAVAFIDRIVIGDIERENNLDMIREVVNQGAGQFGLNKAMNGMDFNKLIEGLRDDDVLYINATFSFTANIWLNKQLIPKVRSGVHVKFLLMDPASKNLEHRVNEVEFQETSIESARAAICEISTSIDKFNASLMGDNASAAKGSIEYRFYDGLPGIPLYLVVRNGLPTVAYSSMFLGRRTQIGFPHFMWGPGKMLDELYLYVRSRWDRNAGRLRPQSNT
jgi:hypothetical protein